MEYDGKYRAFDLSRVSTYPVRSRSNKVTLDDLVRPADIANRSIELPESTRRDIESIATAIVASRKAGRPVIVFTGAHLIKNGLGPLLGDLVRRDVISLVAGNGATAIHDFELALIGQTSENVPDALGEGRFGMAYEFAYFNYAMSVGDRYKLGCGESLGRMICDESFRREVFDLALRDGSENRFAHPEVSVLVACYENDVPFTVHAGIGTDVVDQHPSFDGRAKGGCSGRDFLIYANQTAALTDGGVVLNIGSAVTGPEVLLKAVSVAANTGHVPHNIITADFDLREHDQEAMSDESSQGYYYRDQKSVVTRIPRAFGGKGFYIQGDQKHTFPLLYSKIIQALDLRGAG